VVTGRVGWLDLGGVNANAPSPAERERVTDGVGFWLGAQRMARSTTTKVKRQ
jgi:hypothetical protein